MTESELGPDESEVMAAVARAPSAAITKRFTFEAAHKVPNHKHRCRFLHGHSYKCFITVHGPIHPTLGQSNDGMVMDFGDLKDIWQEHFDPILDHQYLNESIPLDTPTAENICRWIMQKFASLGTPLCKITLWETETSYVEMYSWEVRE